MSRSLAIHRYILSAVYTDSYAVYLKLLSEEFMARLKSVCVSGLQEGRVSCVPGVGCDHLLVIQSETMYSQRSSITSNIALFIVFNIQLFL